MKRLILLFLLSNSVFIHGQSSIKQLQKKVHSVKKDKGKFSLAYIHALISLAEAEQAAELWEQSSKTSKGLYRKLPKNPSYERREKAYSLEVRLGMLRIKNDFRNKYYDDINLWINDEWYDMAKQAQQDKALIEWIQMAINHYPVHSKQAINHWWRAYQSLSSVSNIEKLWAITQSKIAKEFGEDSDEYVGTLFGQANFYARSQLPEKYAEYAKKVEAYWGPTPWIKRPYESTDTSHYHTKKSRPVQAVQYYKSLQKKGISR